MHFQHCPQIWLDFPELVPGVLFVTGTGTGTGTVAGPLDAAIAEFTAVAASRLTNASEAELSEVQAWRRAFSKMSLKPTQYRSASEALLRRFRKEGSLPRVHPLVDLCNAASLAFAIPVAAIDVSKIDGNLEVRYATGDERYLSFAGEVEHPNVGEVIYVDGAGAAHARRWTNRQSGASAVRDSTTSALIVTEAMHASASQDVGDLLAALSEKLDAFGPRTLVTAILSRSSPRFTFEYGRS